MPTKLLRLFGVMLSLLGGLSSCSTMRALESSHTSYHSYLAKHVVEKRIFDRGRERLIVKVMPVTAEFLDLQQRSFGSLSTPLNPLSSHRQFLVALTTGDRAPLFIGDWQVTWQGLPAAELNEIRNLSEVESRYPFAYPFARLYVFNFPVTAAQASTTQEVFEVHSPYGPLQFALPGVP